MLSLSTYYVAMRFSWMSPLCCVFLAFTPFLAFVTYKMTGKDGEHLWFRPVSWSLERCRTES